MPRPKKDWKQVTAQPDQREGLQEAIWGRHRGREMFWATQLAFSADGDIADDEAMKRTLSVVVTEMAAAAAKGERVPFDRLADAVEFLRSTNFLRGKRFWADEVARELVAHHGGLHPGRLNISRAVRELGRPAKTLRKKAKQLGLMTIPGRPRN